MIEYMDGPFSLTDALDDGFQETPDKRFVRTDGKELDRTQHMSASEAWRCARDLVFNKLAKETGGKLKQWGYAKRGDIIEDWVMDVIRLGLPPMAVLTYSGRHQRSFVRGTQSGTPDGIISIVGDSYVLDVKSLDPRTNWNNLVRLKDYYQVQQNMDLVTHTFPEIRIKGGVVWYIDASNLQRNKDFWFPVDDTVQTHLRNKSERVMTSTDPAEMSPEGLYIEGGCDHCKFTKQCGTMKQDVGEISDAIAEAERLAKNVFR